MSCIVSLLVACMYVSIPQELHPFKASLTLCTPILCLYPTSGLLPIIEKGLLFTLTYKPRTFSKDCHGRVVIEVS